MDAKVCRVLLVEDAPDQAVIVQRWLRAAFGAQVIVTTDVRAALDSLKRELFDLVICDVELPQGNGFDLARMIRQGNAEIPILMVTAHTRFDYAVEALRSGVNEFLTKPYKHTVLIETVRELLRELPRRPASERHQVLAIGAHPDDVEIGCGGILLRHRERGDNVMILTLTGGEAGGPESVRAMEAHFAAALLDAEIEIRDLKDTGVGEGSETISVISEVVRNYQPDVVYTHSFNDVHQDHRNAHRATLVAARAVPNVFCYQSPSSTTAFAPTMYVDIERTLQQKLRTIAAYASQTSKCAYLDASLLESTARYWSRFSQARYVEALEVMRCSSYRLSADGAQKRKSTLESVSPSLSPRSRQIAKPGILRSLRPSALRSSRPNLSVVPSEPPRAGEG